MIDIEYFANKVKAERKASNRNGEVPPMTGAPLQVASVVNAGQGTVLDLGGPKFELLASAEGSAYWVMKGTLPAYVSVPLHSHGDAESFYLISGEAEFLAPTACGLQWKTLQPGDFVHIPSNVKHAWRNLSTNPAEVLCATTPRLGRFLCEVGQFVGMAGSDSVLNKLRSLSESYGYWMGSPQENADVGIPLQ
jgi:quercetin dioxygenase-like cupin family protein